MKVVPLINTVYVDGLIAMHRSITSSPSASDNPWRGCKSYDHREHLVTCVLDGITGINTPIAQVVATVGLGCLC